MLAVSGRSGDVRASAAEAVKQDFLEADPYWDTSGMPNNTYKPKEPFTGKIVSYKPGTESSPSQGSRASCFYARFGNIKQCSNAAIQNFDVFGKFTDLRNLPRISCEFDKFLYKSWPKIIGWSEFSANICQNLETFYRTFCKI